MGRSFVFSAFYADFCFCSKLVIITTLMWFVFARCYFMLRAEQAFQAKKCFITNANNVSPASHCTCAVKARGYKICFMLNSTEYEFFLLINVKMPTIVGILTFMSGKNSIPGLSEPKISRISWYFYTYDHLKFHAQLNWAWKRFYNLGTRSVFVVL